MRTLAIVGLAGAALLAPAARADVTIEMKQDKASQTVYVGQHKLRAESPDGTMIFRGDKKVLWVLDPKAKTYSEMTEADVKAMGDKMKSAMAQLDEAMKNVPPEQRAKMMEMMKGRMPAAPVETTRTVKPMGVDKAINGFACSGYTVTSSDGSSSEVWAADIKSLPFEAGDMAVLKELGEFLSSALPGTEKLQDLMKDYEHPKPDQVPGFPVLTIARDKDGKELWREELVKAAKGAIPDPQFELPDGWQKGKSPFGGM